MLSSYNNTSSMRGRRGGRSHGRGHGRNHDCGVRGAITARGIRRGRGRAVEVPPTEIPIVLHQQVVVQQEEAGQNPPLVHFESPKCPRCNPLPLPGALTITSADEMLSCGLGFMALKVVGSGESNRIRFRAHYGIGPESMFAMFTDLKEARDNADPCSLLMAMNFLKCYETEPCIASRWGLPEERTRILVREYVCLVQQMKNRKIVWGGFGNEVHIITVDGIHCRINEPRVHNPGSAHYSHKFNGAGVGYELGIAIYSSRLVWIAGPFPASRHDLTIFRGGKPDEPKDQNALFFKIPQGKKAIGDSAYTAEAGVGGKMAVSRDEDSLALKRFKSRGKARHETFNGRLKAFQVLDVPYRHRQLLHVSVFEAVCVAVQYDMEQGHPLFDMLHHINSDTDIDAQE